MLFSYFCPAQGDQICTPPRMSPASISLDLGSSLDETQLLRDKISRLQQDREHVTTQLSHYRQAAETAQTDLAAEKVATDSLQKEVQYLNINMYIITYPNQTFFCGHLIL